MKKPKFKQEFWNVNKQRSAAEPFPGRTPTRWYIVIDQRMPNKAGKWQSKTIFRYLGKPNLGIEAKVLNLAKHVKGTIWLYEFDKGGPFRAAFSNLPKDCFTLSSVNTVLNAFYYHFQVTTGNFFVGKVYPKYGVMRTKSFFFFGPYEKMNVKSMHDTLRNFKRWISESKVTAVLKKGRRDKDPRHIEVIRFYDLPKPPVPVLIRMLCTNCGRGFTKAEKYRGLVVTCPTCNWARMCG